MRLSRGSAVLCLLAATAVAALRPHGKAVTVLRVLDTQVCHGKKHHLLMHKYAVVLDASGSESVMADVEFTKDIKKISKLSVWLNRCSGGVAPNLCEYYTAWSWTTAVCDLVAARGVFWAPLVDSIHPTFRCPVHAGLYSIRNATYDLSMLHTFTQHRELYDNTWIAEVQIYDEERKLNLCFNTTVSFRRVRKRN